MNESLNNARTSRSLPAHRRRADGFTLVELLVVILIIGMLTGIVAPRLLGQIGKSETTAALAQMDSLAKALDAYRLDMGSYPSTAEGLGALVQEPGTASGRWRGPYLRGKVPSDPWGTPFVYTSPASSGVDYELISLGNDKARGGGGDAADIVR